MKLRPSMLVALLLVVALSSCHPRAADDPIIGKRMHVFERFGITTQAGLRRALIPARTTVNYAWLVSWLNDYPMQAKVRRALLARDPNDLQSVMGLERALSVMGRVDEAVQLLQAARARHLQIRHVRGNQYGKWSVDQALCYLLRVQGHLHQAEDACNRAMAAGDHSTHVYGYYAAALVLDGDGPAALGQAQKAVAAKDADGWSHWILGVTLQAVHMPAKAHAAYKEALRMRPQFDTAWRALHEHHTAAELIVLHRRELVDGNALDLGFCAQYYLELHLPQAAKRCLDAAEGAEPGSSLWVPVIYLGETDPAAAWAKAQVDLKKSRNYELLDSAGWVAYLSGHVDRARSLLDAAVTASPVDMLSNLRLATVCEAQGDEACKEKALAVAVKPTAHDVTSAVVKFLLLLIPILAAYVVIRGVVVRRLRSKAGAG